MSFYNRFDDRYPRRRAYDGIADGESHDDLLWRIKEELREIKYALDYYGRGRDYGGELDLNDPSVQYAIEDAERLASFVDKVVRGPLDKLQHARLIDKSDMRWAEQEAMRLDGNVKDLDTALRHFADSVPIIRNSLRVLGRLTRELWEFRRDRLRASSRLPDRVDL